MKNRGLRELTPPVKGSTFRYKPPSQEWMKKVANLNPDWWYISGHFAEERFFNEPYYRNDFHRRQEGSAPIENPNSMEILMSLESPSELKKLNFFEKYGPSSYPRAKIVLLVGCNTLVYPNVRKYLSKRFPNAIFLGHVDKNPGDATPIVRNFITKYFSKKDKPWDWKHVASSWLSYHDKVKNNIKARGYGLAALYQGMVIGIDVDKSYPRVLGKSGENIYRLRIDSRKKPGRKVDVLIVVNISESKWVAHEGMYEGEDKMTYFSMSGIPNFIGEDY